MNLQEILHAALTHRSIEGTDITDPDIVDKEARAVFESNGIDVDEMIAQVDGEDDDDAWGTL